MTLGPLPRIAPIAARAPRFRRPARAIALSAALVGLALLSGCGGSGSSGPASAGSAGTGNGADASGGTSSTGNSAGSGSGSGSASTAGLAYGNVKSASLGAGASLNGGVPFPADNAWNRDVSHDPVDPDSDNLIASIGSSRGLHPDFGSQPYNGSPIGIPYVVVDGAQTRVAIHYTAYGDESDPGPFPIPGNAPIEGQASTSGTASGDRHVLVIDRDNQRLYELYNAWPQSDGSWNADSGAAFDLTSDTVRPAGQVGWTSADAAGLPIFPGLVRYDEVASGAIHHALRFTVSRSRAAYVPPAVHWASSSTSPDLPPMGMRVRLKASYVIPANFSAQSRVILQAMKTYGMIVADNGSNWFVSGAPDSRWNDDALVSELASVAGSNFEVVKMDGLVAR